MNRLAPFCWLCTSVFLIPFYPGQLRLARGVVDSTRPHEAVVVAVAIHIVRDQPWKLADTAADGRRRAQAAQVAVLVGFEPAQTVGRQSGLQDGQETPSHRVRQHVAGPGERSMVRPLIDRVGVDADLVETEAVGVHDRPGVELVRAEQDERTKIGAEPLKSAIRKVEH